MKTEGVRPALHDLQRALHVDLENDAFAARQRFLYGAQRRSVIVARIAGVLQKLPCRDHLFKALARDEIIAHALAVLGPHGREVAETE